MGTGFVPACPYRILRSDWPVCPYQRLSCDLICTNGMVSKTELSASYRHVSTKILNEFPVILDKVSVELGRQRHQIGLSMESPVDDPLKTIESFNRQFGLMRMSGKRSSGPGHRRQGIRCLPWSIPIPGRRSLRDFLRNRVTSCRGLAGMCWGC